jgi:hypothetical protein
MHFLIVVPSRDQSPRKALICLRIPARGRDDKAVAWYQVSLPIWSFIDLANSKKRRMNFSTKFMT